MHVEPPFSFIDQMVTLRAHLDDCDGENAPLKIAMGSHKIGRVSIDKIADVVANSHTVACLANAGDVWAYATAILHASDISKNPGNRRVLQVDYSRSVLPEGLKWFGT